MKKTTALLVAIVMSLALVLSACDSPVNFTIYFYSDGVEYDTIRTAGNTVIELPLDPTKEGHTFKGWFWDEGTWQQPFTSDSLLDAPLSSNMTVYAYWQVGQTGEQPLDPTKSRIYVTANVDYQVWLEKVAQNFEQKYKDTIFEEEKKGIQVVRNYTTTDAPIQTIPTTYQDVFFSKDSNYAELADSNILLDLAGILSQETDEAKTIEQKIPQQYLSGLKKDNKIYAIPQYQKFMGIVYDVDLFERCSLYFKQGGGWTATPTTNGTVGPDGVSGTYDDGLPATYADFYTLCTEMVRQEITPLTTAINYKNLINDLLVSLCADFEGAEQFMLNFRFDGTANNIVSSFDNGEPVTQPLVITEENAYMLSKQLGRYNALDFVKSLTDGQYFYEKSFRGSFQYSDMHIEFLLSSALGSPIAMVIEDNMWENSAKSAFELLIKNYGSEQEDRKFGFMPLPNAGSTSASTSTLVDIAGSYCFAKASTDASKIEMVSKFVQFAHTDASIKTMIQDIGAASVLYDTTTQERSGLSHFKKSMLNILDDSDVVSPNLYLSAQKRYSMFYSKQGNNTIQTPLMAFINNTTALNYFNGIYSWHYDNQNS